MYLLTFEGQTFSTYLRNIHLSFSISFPHLDLLYWLSGDKTILFIAKYLLVDILLYWVRHVIWSSSMGVPPCTFGLLPYCTTTSLPLEKERKKKKKNSAGSTNVLRWSVVSLSGECPCHFTVTHFKICLIFFFSLVFDPPTS